MHLHSSPERIVAWEECSAFLLEFIRKYQSVRFPIEARPSIRAFRGILVYHRSKVLD